jgi:hypothetical protein
MANTHIRNYNSSASLQNPSYSSSSSSVSSVGELIETQNMKEVIKYSLNDYANLSEEIIDIAFFIKNRYIFVL